MRRTIVMALLGALLFASPALAQGDRVEILRDCQDDGILQGDYSAAKLRDARNNIPTELDEYSDCRDVLSRGIAAKTSSTKSNDNNSSSDNSGSSGGSNGGSNNDSTGGSTDSGGSSSTESDPAPTAEIPDSGRALPTTPQDWAAIHEAQKNGEHIADDLKPVSPGARLTASVGRNGLPGSLIAALAMIVAAALVCFVAPVIRRRGLGTRQT